MIEVMVMPLMPMILKMPTNTPSMSITSQKIEVETSPGKMPDAKPSKTQGFGLPPFPFTCIGLDILNPILGACNWAQRKLKIVLLPIDAHQSLSASRLLIVAYF